MDFKEEYKNEMQKFSPTEEQCERIRSGVMQKLAQNAPIQRKKPLYLRIAAISGTAVCAAAVAVIIFTGAFSSFKTGGSDNMTAAPNNGANIMAGGNTNEGNASAYPTSGADQSISSYHPNDHCSSTFPEGSINNSAPSQDDRPNSSITNPVTGGGDQPGIAGGEYPNTGGGETSSTGKPMPPPTGGGGSEDSFFIKFFNNTDSCEVTVNGDVSTYTKADISLPDPEMDDAAKADNNIKHELFVQFDENIMLVFYKDGTLFGIYEKTKAF